MFSFITKRISKEQYRQLQWNWAEELTQRLKKLAPTGVVIVHGGWMRGCEPFLRVEELEWVEVSVSVNGGQCSYCERYVYPQQPSDSEFLSMCARLQDSWARVRARV
jgi:hypothetical protein